MQAEVKLQDGTIWNNLVTEEKSKPAETLTEYRGQLQVQPARPERPRVQRRRCRCSCSGTTTRSPTTGGRGAADPGRAPAPRNTPKRTCCRWWRARTGRSTNTSDPPNPFEPGRVYRKIGYGPLVDVFMLDMRSYRGPNGDNRQTSYGPDAYFLGPQQIAWLKRELKASKATWKIIAADMPISIYRRLRRDPQFRHGSDQPARQRPAARARAGDRRPARLHQARASATPSG